MARKSFTIELSFIRPILGSQPANPDLRKTYITQKMITGKTGMSGEIAMNKVEGEIENLLKDEDYLRLLMSPREEVLPYSIEITMESQVLQLSS